jgi:long-chain fatty acid transport protein
MRRLFLPLVLLFLLSMVNSASAQYGLNFSAIGPVNRGMGGVATATPVDALGALHWNPATIAALPSSEMAFGVDGVLPVVDIDSSLGAGALGPVPTVDRAGSSESDNGWFAAPAFGVVQQLEDSPYTYGLGIMTVAGFGQNFSASTTNPVLFPDEGDAEGVPGFGNIFAEAVFVEIAPVLAMQVTDNISIGLGPTVTIGRAQASPFPFAPTDNAGGGAATYPEGTHSRYHWGGGFQVGTYLTTASWNFGAAYKSPQWFEKFSYHSTNEVGAPRDFSTKISLPAIASLGVSWTGMENVVTGVDIRYIDWANADLFGDPASFRGDGSLRGLGWDSGWTFALGSQYTFSERLKLRAGYTYGATPIDGNPESGLNVATPLILEHTLAFGASLQVSDALAMHLAYTHGFENELKGPIQTAGGPAPASQLNQRVSAHFLTAGFTVNF